MAQVKQISLQSNTGWTASNIPAWLSLDKTSGTGNTMINATAQDNTGAARSGSIDFNTADNTQHISYPVSQEAVAVAADRMFHSRLYMNDHLTSSLRFDITIGVQTGQGYYEFRHFVVFNNSTLFDNWTDVIPASDQSMITNIDVMVNSRSYPGGVYADMWSDSSFLADTDVMPGGLSWSGNIPGKSVGFIATYSNL